MTAEPTEDFSTASLGELVHVETKEKSDLAKQTANYAQIAEELRAFQIEDDEDFTYASDVLKTIKQYAKQIDARRKQVTDPLNAALKAFRGWYKPAMDALEEGEGILKKKIGEYTLRKEREREEQMRQIAAASSSGDFEKAHAVSQGLVEAPVVTGVSVQRKWDYRVVDMSAVPREFLALDHSAVKIYIKNAGKDKPVNIPGLEFYETTGVIARTG